MTGKISLLFNVILAVAVIFLFIKTSGKVEKDAEHDLTEPATVRYDSSASGVKVAWVNGDSIMARYKFILDKGDDLIKKSKASGRKLELEMQKAEKEYQELVTYAQSGSMSAEDEAILQNRIMELQYNIQAMEAEETEALAKNEFEINKELFSRLNKYLEQYALRSGIELVLNYQPGGQVLFSGPATDITNDVIVGLNQEYGASQTK